TSNARFQPAAQAGLTAAQVPTLRLKWAFGFPNATAARAQPTVVGGRLYVGSQSGLVYALDAKSGCTIWTYQARAAVRSAITIGPRGSGAAAYFGDGKANAYAIDAATGDLLWTRTLDEHGSARVTGAPTLYQDRLYVPIASGEEGQGNNAKYECCTFRGSLVALDAASGALLWKTYTIAAEARPIGTNASGTTRWGPSGAGIWSSPTVDAKRKLVYAATGNMYTEPQQPTSDAIMAFDLDTGAVKWTAQVTPQDVFVVGCNQPNPANCPKPDAIGPDFDFGSSPILATLPNGRDLIVDGQKSGVGWAFDPDRQGAVTWQYRAAKGSALGGMEFGSAADGEQAYFAVADGNSPQPGGLHAVTLATGARAWYAPPPSPACGMPARGCNAAILSAITVMPGVVFTGSNDGAVRAYSTRDGSIVWQFDTNRDFETVNGVKANGASMSGPGPVVAGGMLYVNSGYGALGGRPGNVLLAFGVDDRPAEAAPEAARAAAAQREGARASQASDRSRDLDGIWSFATLTPFERPPELAARPYFTDEEAAAFVADTLTRNDRDRRDGGAATDAARGVADFWFDRGTGVATLDGKKLTSLVVDPPDGRVPPFTAEARAQATARNAGNRDGAADNPENRSLQERCLSFNAGPPINLGPYNNFVQLMQMPNAVIIFTEMIHDARIVWTDGRPHLPPHVKLWLGDSRGRWEGNTLVVDTTNFTGKTGFRGSSDRLHLVERFTRTGPETLRYEYTVDDPATFTKPWTAVLPMTKSSERLYEYACHEGNYALPDILRGARYQERSGK
ncbi:MAG TPA: PQQ-binding-like beta-propeller repeat protein, partial [Vicinamibacterales bacterium]|nr:PQQ-binding-like beta-propeller repeat protein [Vicinamibacterales bacterium]